MEIAGLPNKALEFIDKNSNYSAYGKHNKPIGCKKSDGILKTSAKMYELKKINSIFVPLFEHKLLNCKAVDKLQKITDNFIYVYLEVENDKILKWSEEEIEDNEQQPPQ